MQVFYFISFWPLNISSMSCHLSKYLFVKSICIQFFLRCHLIDCFFFLQKNLETKNEEDFELRLYIPQIIDISTLSAEKQGQLIHWGIQYLSSLLLQLKQLFAFYAFFLAVSSLPSLNKAELTQSLKHNTVLSLVVTIVVMVPKKSFLPVLFPINK